MVCPTIWGKIMLARLQVRMTFFSPRSFIASILFSNFRSTNGPFFKDRPIIIQSPTEKILIVPEDYRRFFRRLRTIYLSVLLFFRVLAPRVGLPQGLFGPGKPTGVRPSPPP